MISIAESRQPKEHCWSALNRSYAQSWGRIQGHDRSNKVAVMVHMPWMSEFTGSLYFIQQPPMAWGPPHLANVIPVTDTKKLKAEFIIVINEFPLLVKWAY